MSNYTFLLPYTLLLIQKQIKSVMLTAVIRWESQSNIFDYLLEKQQQTLNKQDDITLVHIER